MQKKFITIITSYMCLITIDIISQPAHGAICSQAYHKCTRVGVMGSGVYIADCSAFPLKYQQICQNRFDSTFNKNPQSHSPKTAACAIACRAMAQDFPECGGAAECPQND